MKFLNLRPTLSGRDGKGTLVHFGPVCFMIPKIWASSRENLSSGFANNTDQPGQPHSLISAFVIRFLESIICKLAAGEISIF